METENSSENLCEDICVTEIHLIGGEHKELTYDGVLPDTMVSVNISNENVTLEKEIVKDMSSNIIRLESDGREGTPCNESLDEEKNTDTVVGGTETLEVEASETSAGRVLNAESAMQGSGWPEKAVALTNLVKEKSAIAVSSMIRKLSGIKDEERGNPDDDIRNYNDVEDDDYVMENKAKENRTSEWSSWNPLNVIKIGRDSSIHNKSEQMSEQSGQESSIIGRIILYTRLGCGDCMQARTLLRKKGLKFIEINIDIYPTRKLELEKITGSSDVPKLYFNEFLIGGLNDLKAMDESGTLSEKIDVLINLSPSPEAPWPPLPGEDDPSNSGTIDEMAGIVRKLKESISVKDRFYKMRWFKNCFLGSEAVDFLSEDQYLEREEAVEFGRKLACEHFFHHVLEENIFEDANQLYRFLDQDPIVMSQCYNIPRGILDVQPKPITEIASRLRLISCVILEAYVSDDGRCVDYRSILKSEEFARYLRTVEELQRVDLQHLSREEKLAFFINLYNMMVIHAILTWGYPLGPMERKRLFSDFKYVVGGSTYSLSVIHNGILRGNQRPPYNIMKPFTGNDKRAQISLSYPEPLVHFVLVPGTRSGPALRCYSPGNIDKELMEAARDFMRNGGVLIDVGSKVALVTKILKWYSVDFGKNDMEVLKHAANYLESDKSEQLLEMIATTQVKVDYQPYDWSLNC